MSSHSQVNPYNHEAYAHPEVELGGADSVQKTTFVRGAGTEPNQTSAGQIAAAPSHAPSTLIIVVAALAVIVVILYLLGWMTVLGG